MREELIEANVLQKLQDFFCAANGVYLACVGKADGVLTKAFGSKADREFIYSLVDKNMYMSLLSKMEMSDVENVIEEPMDNEYIRMCGVSCRFDEHDRLTWIVVGIIEDKVPEDIFIPESIYMTTEDRYYHSIEFLETLTKQLLSARLNEMIAQEAMQKSVDSEHKMEVELKRSETMTEIVKLLESDKGFSEIVDKSIEQTCQTVGIAGGCLLRLSADGQTVDTICRYNAKEIDQDVLVFNKKPVEEIPFFNGKPYMISYDSIKPDNFSQFFEQNSIKAIVCQPIEVNEKLLMYLCFYETIENRVWKVEDIEFINDVKRIVQSILSKRIVKNSLAGSFASLEAILENVGCGIYVVDPATKSILFMNQSFKDLYVRTIEKGILEEFLFSDRELSKKNCYEETFSEVENKWFDVRKTQINWVDGHVVTLCTTYDITEKKKYQKKIETQANNDFLTGLYNRMRCEQELERYIQKAQMAGTEGALIYIDLDDFKHINDGLGHQYGDVLLKAIAHSLIRINGIENNCYRMGGDEFIVIIADTQKEKLDEICNNIKDIFTKPWFLKGEDYYCTTSMGIAYFPTDGSTVEDVIRKADLALYSAKRKGKNCVEFYNANEGDSSSKRLDYEKNMRNAAMNEMDQFEVYYQPIVDITKEGNPCSGAEALVRWNSGTLGFIQPGDFIPLAEYLGLINPIGEYVMMKAAKRCKYWNDMGHPEYKVNVNLSVVQLLQNDIVKKIKKVLEESRISPKNLRLEVTESLAINDMTRMKKILGEIKELGVGIALDDFGTGYSSLNHIRELPIDVIKIDRCFIEHIGEDDFSDAFVKLVAELAKAIGVTVCVEGVEKKEQYQAMKNMEIKLIQGYFFGKPLTQQDFEEKYL